MLCSHFRFCPPLFRDHFGFLQFHYISFYLYQYETYAKKKVHKTHISRKTCRQLTSKKKNAHDLRQKQKKVYTANGKNKKEWVQHFFLFERAMKPFSFILVLSALCPIAAPRQPGLCIHFDFFCCIIMVFEFLAIAEVLANPVDHSARFFCFHAFGACKGSTSLFVPWIAHC